MLKSKLVVAVLALMLSGSIYAQSDQQKKPEAYKFAEFGEIASSERRAKIKAYHEALVKYDGVDGVIINYGTAKSVKKRRNILVEDFVWCDAFNGVRLTWIDASSQEEVRTALWIVPIGAEFPKP